MAVHERCLQLNYSRKAPIWQNLVLNHQKHLLVCFVGKSGKVSWTRILLQLTGNPRAIKVAAVKGRFFPVNPATFLGDMRRIPKMKRSSVLDSHYKILFVRDPLVRLLSAYRGNILHDPAYQRIIKRVLHLNVSDRLTRIYYFFFR